MPPKDPIFPQLAEPQTGLTALTLNYCAWQRTLISKASMLQRKRALCLFLSWCEAQGISEALHLSHAAVRRYVAAIDDSCNKSTGAPLTVIGV